MVHVLGDGEPKNTHVLTYEPEPQVDACQSDTRPPVVLPSKFGWIAERRMRSDRRRFNQRGSEGSQDRVT